MQMAPTERWRNAIVELFLLEEMHATETYVRWLNDPEVNRYLESRFAVHDAHSVQAFIATCRSDARTLFLGIRSVELQRHVGNVKLAGIDVRHGLGEVGIMLGDQAAWGRGLATAALECLAQIAALELDLRKLTAGCYASNVASARAFEKAGFHVEGRRAAHYLLDGKPEDLILMARHLPRSADHGGEN